MDERAMIPIRRLLAEERFREAKDAIEAGLQENPDHLLLFAHLAAVRMELGDYDRSLRELTDAVGRAVAAKDQETQAFAELWLGYLCNRQHRFEEAIQHFEAAAAIQPPSADLCGVLCQTYMTVGRIDKAKLWGMKSIEMRATEGVCTAKSQVACVRPRKFSPTARDRNVISFSLFGEDPFYQECAVTVARSARGVFPEFTCWFYCSASIPWNIKDALARAGSKVMTVNSPPGSREHPYSSLFWRFLPFDEGHIDVVLVRDVDSPFTLRERAAIDYWLAADAPFLSMRDHVQHTEPLMAGMWGGFTGLLPPLAPIMIEYRPAGKSRYVNQMFLRQFVWPRIRDATLVMDSVYKIDGSVDFPPEASRPGALAVGSGWRREQILRGT